jgi:crotonobetainyl-CoA:carnitine CoA-transferase CaiB-like acyl-CoA transferase
MDATLLNGLRVLALGERIAVDTCCKLLGLAGAAVHRYDAGKAESTLGEAAVHRYDAGKAESALGCATGRSDASNGRAVALDEAALERAVLAADVIVVSSDAVHAPTLEAARRIARRAGAIMICDITGAGVSGPYSRSAHSDAEIQALTGLMDTTGFPDAAPMAIGLPYCEVSAGAYAAASIAAALVAWRRNGLLQDVDVSLYGAATNALTTFLPHVFAGKDPHRLGNRHSSAAPWNAYRTADGWILICTSTQDQWQRMSALIGSVARNDAYAKPRDRVVNAEQLDVLIGRWTSGISTAECLQLCATADIPAGPVLTVAQLADDPNVRHRRMIDADGKPGTPFKLMPWPTAAASTATMTGTAEAEPSPAAAHATTTAATETTSAAASPTTEAAMTTEATRTETATAVTAAAAATTGAATTGAATTTGATAAAGTAAAPTTAAGTAAAPTAAGATAAAGTAAAPTTAGATATTASATAMTAAATALRAISSPRPTTDMDGPLAGMRVIEIGQYTTAPLVGKHLAALGAEVLKIEPPGGDPTRDWPHGQGDTSYFFALSNTDKASVTIDLKTEEGKTTLRHMLSTADVFVENLRPGAMERLGFGPAQLAAINPRLVYCAISGFGACSAYPGRPAFDTVIQAMSGFMDLTGAGGTPTKAGISAADILSGQVALFVVIAALLNRDHTNAGAAIDIAMQDVAVWATAPRWHHPAPNDEQTTRCADGYLLLRTADAIGPDEFKTLPRTVAQAVCAGRNIRAVPVYSVAEVIRDPHFTSHSLGLGLDPAGRFWPVLSPPYRYSFSPGPIGSVLA